MSNLPTDSTARNRATADDWVTVFLRLVLSLLVGLPLGGLLLALWTLAVTIHAADPVTQEPWSLALRILGTWIGFIVFGGFAWTPEDGYHSLHGWYAAGVVLAFVLAMRPWRRLRRPRRRGAEPKSDTDSARSPKRPPDDRV